MNRHSPNKKLELFTIQRPGPTPDRVRVLMGPDALMIIPEDPYRRYPSYGRFVLRTDIQLGDQAQPEVHDLPIETVYDTDLANK